jgi:hypothetical protein
MVLCGFNTVVFRPRRGYQRRSFHFRPGAEAIEPRLLLSASPADVLTYRNDNARTGQDLGETILNPANVNPSRFGKLFTDPVDGTVYAQPLYMANVAIPGVGTHNVVFVVTMHDSVYAFDADQPGPPLWHDSFIDPAAGVTTVAATAPYQLSYGPELGIMGTPVIDPTTGTLYVVAETQVTAAGSAGDSYSLHALDVATGAEKFGGPVLIDPTAHGTGKGAGRGGIIRFNAAYQLERPALLLSDGLVYAAFGSLNDIGPYHGWIVASSASTLQTVADFNITPDGSEGALWMSGNGPAADAGGDIYVLTANGTFDANAGRKDYGDSFLKLSPTLHPLDYFTPPNQAKLAAKDLDLGSGGPLLVTDQQGAAEHLLIGGGKDGTLYVINRDRMGHYRPKLGKAPQAIANPVHGIFSSPAYYNGMVYMNAVGDLLKQYEVVGGRLIGPVAVAGVPANYPGATPSVSADGDAGGIVWELVNPGTRAVHGSAVLRAFDAANVGDELYESTEAGSRDALGTEITFSLPTIAGGKVYVVTASGLTVFGLLG